MMHERNEVSNDWFHRQASAGEAVMGIARSEFTQFLLEELLNRHEQPETENTPFA